MNFQKIVDEIAEKIAAGCGIPKSQIIESLNFIDKDKLQHCSIYFNRLSNNPEETAKKVGEYLKKANFPEIKDVTFNQTHVLFNINLKQYYFEIFKTINSMDSNFGKNEIGAGKNVVIDYSSPNIAKLFHVGHYRTTILGNFIKNLLVFSGYKVVSLNYLGDWGKQFGLVLLGFEMYGDENELKNNPLMHLFNVYVKINNQAKCDPSIDIRAREIFREMEESKNEKYLSKWRQFREISIEKFKELYKMLNIEFDVYSGESFYTDQASKFAESTNLADTDDDGSKYIDCGKLGKVLIRKSDGTTLYITRDIVSAIDRINKYNPSKLIYVVSDEQNLNFLQLFSCMEKLGYEQSMFQHVNFGRVKGMSTRNGNVSLIEDIIETSAIAIKSKVLARERLSNTEMDEIDESEINKTAHILAISTLLIADFEAKRIKGYTFDADQRANCEKGSGAYLQYAHCRLLSIEKVNESLDLSNVDLKTIDNDDFLTLSYKLLWFERVILFTLNDYEPSRIVSYVMDLAKYINNLISKYRIKGELPEVASSRLFAFKATRIVIRNCLEVLGIEPLNKM